jgi:hypothetical protein
MTGSRGNWAWTNTVPDSVWVISNLESEPGKAHNPASIRSFPDARHSGVSCREPISIAHCQGTCLPEDMRRKVLAIVGSAVFLVIAPGFVAGWVPWWISRWRLGAPFFAMSLFRFAGGLLITLGGISLLDSFVRFARQGLGTPAPLFATRHLVVTGLFVMFETRCTSPW